MRLTENTWTTSTTSKQTPKKPLQLFRRSMTIHWLNRKCTPTKRSLYLLHVRKLLKRRKMNNTAKDCCSLRSFIVDSRSSLIIVSSSFQPLCLISRMLKLLSQSLLPSIVASKPLSRLTWLPWSIMHVIKSSLDLLLASDGFQCGFNGSRV